MNKRLSCMIIPLMLSISVQAAEKMSMPMNEGLDVTPAQQSYQQGMDKMHHQMMAGMEERDPDIAFAKGMIAHHQGAIDMAKTELKYGNDPEMRALAQAIIKAQQPEIDQMQNWLKQRKK